MKPICPKYNTDCCFRFLTCKPEDPNFKCGCATERYY